MLETGLGMELETELETGLRFGLNPNMATKSNNCCSFKLVEELGFSFHFLSNSN